MADEQKPTAQVAEKPQSDAAPKWSDVIETWFRDHFAGTSICDTTERYNAAYAAKEDLKKRLAR